MLRWQRVLLWSVGIGLLAVWPVRWAFQGLPGGLLAIEGGGAWPLHLLAEASVSALLLWSARSSLVRPAGLVALGTVVYSSLNGLSYGVYGNAWHVGISVAKLAAAAVLALALSGTGRGDRRAAPRWPGVLLALVGLGMIGFWSLQIFAGGIMKDGLWSAEGNAYLIFHVTAELLAGAIALAGGLGLLMRRRSMVAMALAGAGGVYYAATNSAGWAVVNDAAFVVVFAISALVAVVAAAGLWRSVAGAETARRAA